MAEDVESDSKLDIAHILSIDVVGYSTLLIDQQTGLVRELTQLVRETPRFREADLKGALLSLPTGDGMVLVFRDDAEAPIQCAMQIEESLKQHPEIRLRMGIHSGPVNPIRDVNNRPNLAGAGIDTAQRVLDCGDAGHILVSKRVADDLSPHPRWNRYLHPLGECEVKHGQKISLFNFHSDSVGNPQLPQKLTSQPAPREPRKLVPIGKTLLYGTLGLALCLAAAFFFTRASARTLDKSIAVLPFDNFSDDKESAFFADGAQDEILTSLAKVSDLKVISRTSVMPYRGKEKNVREIGSALGVSAILEGSVRKFGNKVRLSVQLINAVKDEHIWAEDYDRDLTDIFAIQTDLAQKIAHELQAKLSPAEQAQITRKPTENGEAYLAYLQGHNLYTKVPSGTEERKQAEKLYERALQLDPNFALAAAEYSRLNSVFGASTEQKEKARTLAERALALQPDLALGHLALGDCYYFFDRDYDRAMREFQTAKRGLPNSSEVHLAIGRIQGRQGKWAESDTSLTKAVELSPNETRPIVQLAGNYSIQRNFSKANEITDRALRLSPDLWFMKAWLELRERGTSTLVSEFLATHQGSDQTRASAECFFAQVLLLQRKYADALQKAENFNDAALANEPRLFDCKYTVIGLARKRLGDDAGARAALLKAKERVAKRVSEAPNDWDGHSNLAEVLAWLGEKETAIAEAKRGTELLPESVDAVAGPRATETLAEVYAIVGENEKAIDLIDGLLARPSELTVALLRIDPVWDPLREHPRFIELLKKYSGTT